MVLLGSGDRPLLEMIEYISSLSDETREVMTTYKISRTDVASDHITTRECHEIPIGNYTYYFIDETFDNSKDNYTSRNDIQHNLIVYRSKAEIDSRKQ